MQHNQLYNLPDEQNIVRYAAGYVPYKLLNKYKKSKSASDSVKSYTECLMKMGVDGPEESFLAYTEEWINQIDRGGLFHISDLSFMLF